MTTNKALKKSLQEPCIKSAATHAVRILQSSGLICVVVGPLAARMHGSNDIPTMATLAVLPGEGAYSPHAAYQVLVDAPGQLFIRRRHVESDRLIYHDPTATISDHPARKCCEVKLTIMIDPVPGYRQGEIQRIGGLPVISFLPLLVYSSKEMMERHRQKFARAGKVSRMTALESIPSGYMQVMKQWNRKEVIPIHDEDFTNGAIFVLNSLSGRKYQPFVELCLRKLPGVTSMHQYLPPGLPNLASNVQKPKSPSMQVLPDIYIKHAASDAINIIKAAGFVCLIVGPLAAWLHGSNQVPEEVTLAILSRGAGFPPPRDAYHALIKSPGKKFEPIGQSEDRLVYNNPRVTQSNKPDNRICEIHLAIMDGLVPGYREKEIQHIGGLPVVSFLPMLVYAMEAQATREIKRSLADEKPLDSSVLHDVPQGPRKVATKRNGKEIIPIEDQEFNALANSVLKVLSESIQSSQLGSFIQLSRQQLESRGQALLSTVLDGKDPQPPLDGRDADSTQPVSAPSRATLHAVLDGKDEVSTKSIPDPQPLQNTPRAPPSKVRDNQAEVIFQVAKLLIKIFQDLQFRCAIRGSGVCNLYDGITTPDTIALIIFHPKGVSMPVIKKALSTLTPHLRKHFHFKNTKPPSNTRVYFRLKSLGMKMKAIPRNMVKIDIHTPETLNTPTLTEDDVVFIRELPVIPFTVLTPLAIQASGGRTLGGQGTTAR